MDIGLLGPLRLQHDGRPVALGGPRARTLVVALVLARRRALTVDRITELVWGDEQPAHPANAVQAQMSRLRRALATAGVSGRLHTTPGGYRLDVADDEVDVWRFDDRVTAAAAALDAGEARRAEAELTDALRSWRGRPLADLGDAPFIDAERRRLDDQHALACRRLATAQLALGRHDDAVASLRAATARHALDERLHALLMTALYRAGRATEALDVHRELRERLAELGLEPGPDLAQLQVDVLSHAVDPGDPPPAPARPASLPTSSFIGREEELRELRTLLDDHRMVTLIGPGGSGKTRLALEATAQLDDRFSDARTVVELAAVTDPGAVLTAVSGALRAPQPVDLRGTVATVGRGDALAQVRALLRGRAALLVLDNCEHLIDAAAHAADGLLRACPELVVLATSREPLHIPGERLVGVAPLPVPATADDDPVVLADNPAVRLFVDRAQAADPTVQLTPTTAAAIATICRRLDGLPLALELAAARVRLLDVAQIADRLDDRFRLLTGGPRTALPRQRTLEAVVGWSYALLDDAERRAFQCLSVFSGGASLEAAEAVCRAQLAGDGASADRGPEPLDVLAALVDKSLIATERHAGARRFVLLETLRDFGRRTLADSGRGDAVRTAHARWFAGLAQRADDALRGPDQVRWLDRLDRERDNLAVAFAWLLATDADAGVRMASALAWWSAMRGEPGAGVERLATALDAAPASPDRAPALAWLALLIGFSGDTAAWDRALAASSEALRLSDEARDRPAGLAAVIDGYLAGIAGDTARAIRDLDHAEAIATADDDGWARATIGFLRCLLRLDGCDLDTTLALFLAVGDGWGIVQTLTARADAAVSRGALARACEDMGRASELADARGLVDLALSTRAQLANLHMLRGDHEVARRLHRTVLDRTTRPRRDQIAAVSLNGLGMLARRDGDLEAAERHHRAALDRYERAGDGATLDNAGVALCLCHLGFCAAERGDGATARRLLARARRHALRSPDLRGHALLAEALAAADLLHDDPAGAARRLGWAERVRADQGSPLPAEDRRDVDRIARAVRDALGDADAAVAMARGARLDDATQVDGAPASG